MPVVTFDALHSQTAHARFLVEDKHAHYIALIKGMDLGLTLVPEDEGQPMALCNECIIGIDGDTARVRC
jgi:hypothetical protein